MAHNDIRGLYGMGWHAFRAVFRLYFGCRVFHPERVPLTGPVIIAANHASYIDPPLIGCGIDRMLFILARASLFRFPIFGPLLRSWHAIPVDPKGGSSAGLKAILDRLERGGAVLVFPEGTRTSDGRLLPARAGLGLAIIRSNAVVVPARVWGTHRAYGRHITIPRPLPVAVKYGYPLAFDSERAQAREASREASKAIYQRCSDRVMKAIASLQPCRDKSEFP